MKILASMWFTDVVRTTGIVLAENEQGAKKAFIGSNIEGRDEWADAMTIVKLGAKFPEAAAKALFPDKWS